MDKFVLLGLCACILQIQAIIPSVDNSGRIVGGSDTYAGEYPFVVAIYKDTGNGTYFCTGTLIYNQWVLTAAQCVVNAVLFTIRLGSNSLSDEDDPNAITVATEHYVIHPDFNPTNLNNDIGLIKFRQPVQLSDYIRTVNYISETDPQRIVLSIGWGQTSDNAPGIEDILRVVALVPLSNAACRITYGNQITDNMICAAGNFHEGICRGDIGGPLIRSGIGPTYLDGIASFFSARGCDNSDPSGYTRISRYVSWIQNAVSNN